MGMTTISGQESQSLNEESGSGACADADPQVANIAKSMPGIEIPFVCIASAPPEPIMVSLKAPEFASL